MDVCRVRVEHCIAPFSANNRMCAAGIERVLERYNLDKNQFYGEGIPATDMEGIDNVLVAAAVARAREQWELANGRE